MIKLNTQKIIKSVEKKFLNTDLPILKIGDSVKIGVKIIEGNKERVQFYEGTILAKKKYLYQYNNYSSKSISRNWC